MTEISGLKKFLVLATFGVTIALAALIASLPLNLPSNQVSQTAVPTIDGDTAWMIVATILGLFLTPALAYLYSLLHGTDPIEGVKNVLVVSSMITFLWVLFSFSMVYGKDAKSNGILGYPGTFYMFKDTSGDSAVLNNAANIPNSIFAVFELCFALLSAGIVSSSVAGRIELNGFLFFMFVWHLTVYCPVAHITWNPQGAFATNDIEDFSGALPVHSLAAVTALVLHIILGKDAIPTSKPVAEPEKALLWAMIVWFLWFGFNAGKAHGANAVATQSIVNTIAATTASVITSFFYTLIMEKHLTSVTLVYAVLIGLVAITPASGFVTVGGAMVIGIFTYAFTAFVSQFVLGENATENEPFSVVSVHAIGGAVGFLWTAIISYKFVNAAGENGLTYGRGIPLAYHISFLLALWGSAAIAVALIAFIANLLFPIGNGVISAAEHVPVEATIEGTTTEKQLEGALELNTV